MSTTVMVLEEVALCVGLLGEAETAARVFGAIQFLWATKRASSLLRVGIYPRNIDDDFWRCLSDQNRHRDNSLRCGQ